MNAAPLTHDALCPECERIFAASVPRCPYDGSRLVNLNAGLAPGTIIDNRYTLKRLLGRGGMGSVYLARQHSMDREVAVKIMHHRADGDHSAVQRFFWEVRAARRLQSPHTITVYDFGQTERGSLYLAMELLKGMTLARHLSLEGRLSVPRALAIVVQICRSLEEAHAHNIIHRDLKPENIFLTRRSGQEDLVKVLDFGVAKFLDPDTQLPLTKTGTVFGTPRYMSPEQASSEAVDSRSDLYSLGVILYEMLTGRPPFAEASPLELLNKHVHALPPLLSEHLPDLEIDARLEALVGALLAKNPNERPSSARLVRQQALSLLEEAYASQGGLLEATLHLDEDLDETRLDQHTQQAQALTGVASVLNETPPLGLTPQSPQHLLGRENEYGFARSALERAFHRQEPVFLWLSGEPGIGKKRFAKYLSALAREDFHAHAATGSGFDIEGEGLLSLRLLLEGLFDSTLLEREALRELLEHQYPEAPDLVEALTGFLRPNLSTQPPPFTQSLQEVCVRALLRLAQRRPLCLDMGELGKDDPRLRILESLAATAQRAPCPLVVLVRISQPLGQTQSLDTRLQQLGWKGERDTRLHVHLQLKRLQGEAFRQFCSGIGRGFSHIAPYLHYLTGGHTADTADLISILEALPTHLAFAQAWTPWSKQPIPADLPCALTERSQRPLSLAWQALESIPHADMTLVYMALLGEHFHIDVLEHALELNQPEALAKLDWICSILVRTGCLHEVSRGQFSFVSGMIRELILAHLRSPSKRRKLHTAIAYALEAAPLVGDHSQRDLELAAHWEAAQAYDEALRYRLRYAQTAHSRGERELSLQGYLLALEAFERHHKHHQAAAPPQQLLEIHLNIATLRLELSSYQQAAEAFTALNALAQAQGAALIQAEAELGLARAEEGLTEYGAACKRYLSAAERFIQLQAFSKAAHCEFKYAQCLERRGDFQGARLGYEKARKRFAHLQEQSGLALTYHALGQLALHQGDSADALRLLRRAADLQQHSLSSPETARVLYDLALAASERNEYVLAREAATKALRYYEAEEHPVGTALSLLVVARAFLATGRPMDARPHLERALHLREELGDRRGIAEIIPLLAKASLSLEHPERARELALRARELNLQLGEPLHVAQALLTLASAEAALKKHMPALSALREAILLYRAQPLLDAGLVEALVQLSELQRDMNLQADAMQSLEQALSLAQSLKLTREITHLQARLRALGTSPS